MPKLRILILISTLIVVGIMGFFVSLYARGFRFDLNDDKITLGPTGILVANSDPAAAQVFIDGELETATDNTLSLSPKTYYVEIKKEGYLTWAKNITIEKETVTQVDAFLMPSAPSLTAMTFSGATNPKVAKGNTKIAYIVPQTEDNIDKAGLWLMESVNLPLGFNRDPRQITDGDLSEAEYEFSPDGREILLTVGLETYLLDLSDFISTQELVDVTANLEEIKLEWSEESQKKLEASLTHLPNEVELVLLKNATDIIFSPDENRILYTASGSATIPENQVKELPGSSTQPEEREIKDGSLYVYDIREDKNFKVSDSTPVYWLPNSLNLVRPVEGKIEVLDYDGTNAQAIFSGNYEHPYGFATTSSNRIIILTNFATGDDSANLYWLTLK